MDPITHGLLGACTSQAVYQSRYPNYRLWIFGLLAAMAPDLDIFIHRANDPLLLIYFHRNFTHSLLFVPIGASIIATIALLLWPRYRTIACATWVTCLLGYATHGLLDCLTSFGTMWYWPFTDKRVAWDIISIVDPKFTAILLVGVIISAGMISSRAARVTLIVASLFIGFAAYQHQRASQSLTQFASKKWHVDAYRVMPSLASISNYLSVVRTSNQKIHTLSVQLAGVNKYNISQGPEFQLFTQKDLPQAILQNPILLKDFTIFNWFSDGYIAAYHLDPLVLADLRFIHDFKPPYRTLWGIEFPHDNTSLHVIWRNNPCVAYASIK